MTEPINLTQLRERAEHRGIVQREDGPVITFADWHDVLALIDLAEAARDELPDEDDPAHCYHPATREALARFTTGTPT